MRVKLSTQSGDIGLDFTTDHEKPFMINPARPALIRAQRAFRTVTVLDVIKPPDPLFHNHFTDVAALSKPVVSLPEAVLKVNLVIKAPETPIYIPKGLEMAAPFVRDVFALQAEQGYDVSDLWAQLIVHQGFIKPGSVLNLPDTHIDAGTELVSSGYDGNARQYSACNINPTSFYPGVVLNLSPDLKFMRPQDSAWRIREALNLHGQTAKRIRPEPGQIVELESVTPHAETVSVTHGFRTFIMVRMFQRGGVFELFGTSRDHINNAHALHAYQQTGLHQDKMRPALRL